MSFKNRKQGLLHQITAKLKKLKLKESSLKFKEKADRKKMKEFCNYILYFNSLVTVYFIN